MMTTVLAVRSRRAGEPIDRCDELAYRLAKLATSRADIDPAAADAAADRLLDSAAVAAAALSREPVAAARAQALAHPRSPGATIWGLPVAGRYAPAWAGWANAVAIRELDYNDTFLGADFAHPSDAIAPVLAVAQHKRKDGRALVRGILASYQAQVALTEAIDLHSHRIDHVAHLAPAVAVGIGALLDLDVETVYQAVNQAVHVSTATRQSRKGRISSWKAFAPAHAGKMAIEAVDRAMRGQRAPAPVYEGADGVIAWLLDGPDAQYDVVLPGPDEPHTAILRTYAKAHSAEYQAQALIDLAFRVRAERPDVQDPDAVASIVLKTSAHTHEVIGSGAGDPEKYDPGATRETLDHSAPYILSVALQDGAWHHERSYAPARASRHDTVELWRKITTVEDPEWTARYHAARSGGGGEGGQAFGGELVIEFADGETKSWSIAVADAHPMGAAPFGRADAIRKLRRLAFEIVPLASLARFEALVGRLVSLTPGEVATLSFEAVPAAVARRVPEGIC